MLSVTEPVETLDLMQLEGRIERGLQSFYEAGQALQEIHQRKLYRLQYESFEEYCRERWNMGRSHAYQLMSASQVIQRLSATADRLPSSERQVRPLTRLSAEQQPQAWKAAQQIAEEPTAEQVERSVQAIRAKVQPQLEQGQRVTVTDQRSAFYGQTVEVVAVEDVIVRAKLPDGRLEPFFSNEINSPEQPPEQKEDWTSRGSKVDRMEALEAMLEAEQRRVALLEGVIRQLVDAARRCNAADVRLLAEADRLIS